MVIRLNGLSVWGDAKVRERLPWYRAVMKDEKPAKFLISKRIPTTQDLDGLNEEELWEEHRRLSASFKRLHSELASGDVSIEDMAVAEPSFLDVKVELLNRILNHCHLCEWRCGIDRVKGVRKGACRQDATSRVSTWFQHYGEEAPLVSSGGSGTIFFAGCTFRCVFCQNWDISQDPSDGIEVDEKKLALIMQSLRQDGACNINFVGGEPTPNLRTIVMGMKQLNVNVPMLWNSNMYCSKEAMEILSDIIDIWLPDFKYGNDQCAVRLSKVVNYIFTVERNHQIAHEHGDMIVRHLVMPNHIGCCTKPVLTWISKYCTRALVNIMGQYHPDHLVPTQNEKYGDIARRISGEEMSEAYSIANDLGIAYESVS